MVNPILVYGEPYNGIRMVNPILVRIAYGAVNRSELRHLLLYCTRYEVFFS